MSLNKVQLIGNLGDDPESRTTGSGTAVVNLRIATNERRKAQGSDEWEDHTEWHRVVCFGKLAENCAQYLRKGREVYIEGKVRTRKWEDKDGVTKYTTEVWADVVLFLGGGREGGREDDRGNPDERGGNRGGDGYSGERGSGDGYRGRGGSGGSGRGGAGGGSRW